MFQNKTLEEFKQKLFSKFSKKHKTSEEFTKSKNTSVYRSSSICSIKVTSNEDIVEESIEKGLPIIPFGSPTFVIAEENARILKGNNRRSSLKGLKGRITRHNEENKEHQVKKMLEDEVQNEKVNKNLNIKYFQFLNRLKKKGIKQ